MDHDCSIFDWFATAWNEEEGFDAMELGPRLSCIY